LRRLFIVFAGLFLAFNCHAQTELTAFNIGKMMRGQWVSGEDTTFTITINGDTMIENKRGDLKRFTFTLDKESCDPQADNKLARRSMATTGFYINESSTAFDGVEFCNVVVAVSDSVMVWYTTGKLMNLKKKK